MEGGYYYVPASSSTTSKMKRKDLEDVNDDFSLSSPARKIRRLDAELPPIMEEDEASFPPPPLVFEQPRVGGRGPVIEELPAENEERAVVLFKPVPNENLWQHSPSRFSVTVDSNIINGFRNQLLWHKQSKKLKELEDESRAGDEYSGSPNECLAVVPWVPSQLPPTAEAEVPDSDAVDWMEVESSAMDTEDNIIDLHQRPANESGGVSVSEGLHQWQQQHCMFPQPPENTSTPIVWFR